MMRLQADEDLVGHLRGHCRRTAPRRLRLLRSVHVRGFVMIAREDRPSGFDGRSDHARASRSAVGATTAARVEQAKTFCTPYTSALSDSALI